MSIPESVTHFIRSALDEDIGKGDVTTKLLIPRTMQSTGVLIAKEGFVIAGLTFAKKVFHAVDASIAFNAFVEEGEKVRKSSVIAELRGMTRSLLVAERTALNILQRLSGIATQTSRFVSKLRGLDVKVLDTRKTMPGMRYMEKHAVLMGGGQNHRMGLYDGILIKDNHIQAAGSIAAAVAMAKGKQHLLKIEVEAENLNDVKEALKAGADIIMLDNMPVDEMKKAVKAVRGRALLEASGNITLQNIREVAETGVDFISVGALTHSAPSADISMKLL